jgi:hypothetical protein
LTTGARQLVVQDAAVTLQHGDRLHLAAGLEHQVATAPVGVGDGLVGAHPDALAIDHHAIAIAARLMLPAAMHRVEIEQVRVGGGVTCRVVDLHELHFGPVPGGAQGQTADAAKTVDAYFDGHVDASVSGSRRTG